VLVGRQRRADEGEASAGGLLASHGWTIEGRQVSARYSLRVDGEAASILVRADYVVRRRGRRYVAEVKTGRIAPRLETASTRRQLLEYRLAFDVDGVLLVDADRERIAEVEFPERAAPRVAQPSAWWMLGVAALVALWFLGAHEHPASAEARGDPYGGKGRMLILGHPSHP
jgi:hypothetical protein